MSIIFLITLFILGACLGSFLCCSARRLKLKTKKSQKLGSRSVCLSCKRKLTWYENIPIFSWLFLRGKCRTCGKKIGLAEFLSELGVALAFLLLGTTFNFISASPLEWGIFLITLVLTLALSFLAIYDGLYGELPMKSLMVAIILGLIIAVLKIILSLETKPFSVELILAPLASISILGGLYLLLYLFSKGKWVGSGDWLLGISIGLALFDPWLALVALFLANVIACLVMAPVVKKTKNKTVYFGPFLVIAFVLALTFSDFLFYAIGR